MYEKTVAWHRYLATARDPSGSGLITIYHPWESGTDNSPRWDAALARIEVGTLPHYERHDLKHVQDAAQRPTNAEYDRYLWLVELLKAAGYDDATIQRDHPFQIQDVLMSAIFAAANQVLAEVGKTLGRPAAETDELLDWSRRSSQAVSATWDPELDLALDQDVHSGPIRVETCAGLSPVLLPDLDPEFSAPLRQASVWSRVRRRRRPGLSGGAQHRARLRRFQAAELLAWTDLAGLQLADVVGAPASAVSTTKPPRSATRHWACCGIPARGSRNISSRSPPSPSARSTSRGPPPSRSTGCEFELRGGNLPGDDVAVQPHAGWRGFEVQLPLQRRAQVLILAGCEVALAGLGVQPDQSQVGFFVDWFAGHHS